MMSVNFNRTRFLIRTLIKCAKLQMSLTFVAECKRTNLSSVAATHYIYQYHQKNPQKIIIFAKIKSIQK
ncbi:hypothetical protein EG358_09065 [Chryseobacterium indoltheticum]|nr:hypothetical protein EG358_09065 [Chryseobacterium indoltheticum]